MGYKINKGFMWVRGPKIPSEYQEVEWIEGMGITNLSDTYTMRIDTGINATSSVGVYAKMYKIGTRNDSEWFYANIDGTTSRRGLTTYPSGNWCPQWETWRQTNIAYNTQQWYEIKFNYNNNRQTLIDNTNIYSMTSATFNSNNNIFIGRESHGSSYGWRCAFFKITDGTTLVRDLVPCYRKSDNVIGMYDRVEGQFYTNAGTGAFTKGNDVAPTYVFKEKQFYPGNSSPFTPVTVEYSFPGKNLQTDFIDKGCVAQDYITINSNGLTDSTSSSDRYGRLWIPMEGDLSGASSFSITANLYGTSGSWAGGYYFGATSTTNFDDGTRIGGSINFSNNSGYNGQNLDFDRSTVASTYLTIGTGNYVCTLSVDFNTGLFKHEVTGASSWTLQYTLSESQLNEIKSNLQWIGLSVGHGVYNTKYFTSVSYTIQ